jgi:hypothetical protein
MRIVLLQKTFPTPADGGERSHVMKVATILSLLFRDLDSNKP